MHLRRNARTLGREGIDNRQGNEGFQESTTRRREGVKDFCDRVCRRKWTFRGQARAEVGEIKAGVREVPATRNLAPRTRLAGNCTQCSDGGMWRVEQQEAPSKPTGQQAENQENRLLARQQQP